MTLTVPHVGVRHVESITRREVLELVDTPRSFLAPTCWANAPLPDDALTDPASPAAVAELVQQTRTGLYVNASNFTAQVFIVPADQPLAPVASPRADSLDAQLAAVLRTGLPIPDDYEPQGDSDDAAVFYQPDYVSPGNVAWHGRLYEAWKLRPNPDTTAGAPKWTASWGGRMVGVEANPGHYVNWQFSGYRFQAPADLDSTYQKASWGVTASSIPLLAGLISDEDLALGVIEHAVGLAVIKAGGGARWPAMRTDGSGTAVLREGMRFRLPAGWQPQGSSRFVQMLETAFTRYPLIIWDQSVNAVTLRSHPTCWPLFDGHAGYDVLKSFPWSSLQLLATGTDARPNPT